MSGIPHSACLCVFTVMSPAPLIISGLPTWYGTPFPLPPAWYPLPPCTGVLCPVSLTSGHPSQRAADWPHKKQTLSFITMKVIKPARLVTTSAIEGGGKGRVGH